MAIEFDPAKDKVNVAKHGISLAQAGDIEMLAVAPDTRLAYGENRYRAWGVIDGQTVCLAFAVRNGVVRAISLRRAHAKEMRRHVEKG